MNWIDEELAKEADRNAKRDLDREWRLRCDRLIDAKSPILWQRLLDQVESDVARLNEGFRHDASRQLTIERSASAPRFTIDCPVSRRGITAEWLRDARSIALQIRSAQEPPLPVRVSHDEILFQCASDDQVVMSWVGPVDVEKVSERLIKRLL